MAIMNVTGYKTDAHAGKPPRACERALFHGDAMTGKRNVSTLFGLVLHAWENIMITSLAVAAVAAVVVGLSTYSVVQLQRAELAASQHEMDHYKQQSNERIATADARAAEANKTAAEAARETAVARLEAEQLRLRLVWRLIDPEARMKLTAAMQPFAPKRFAVQTYMDDAEASNLAASIREALSNAGWQFTGISGLKDLHTGVWLAWANETGPQVADVVHPFHEAMKDGGVELNGDIVGWTSLDVGVLYIIVGRKSPSSIEIPALKQLEKAKN